MNKLLQSWGLFEILVGLGLLLSFPASSRNTLSSRWYMSWSWDQSSQVESSGCNLVHSTRTDRRGGVWLYHLWSRMVKKPICPLERGLSRGVWKDQTMSHEPSCAYAAGIWKTSHLVYDEFGRVDGMYTGATWRVREKRARCLLLEQEVHGLWNELLPAWKNVLCFSLGVPPFKTIHAEPYHLVDIQDGPG